MSYRLLTTTLVALLTLSAALSAQIGKEFTFTTNSIPYTSITGTQVIAGTTASTYGTFNQSITTGTLPIGFTFVFNCTNYTTFTTNAQGFLTLGSTPYTSLTPSLDGAGAYPIIAPYWGLQHLYDGACSPSIDPSIGVYYTTTGTAPNRVLTVEWRTQFVSGGTYYWYDCTRGPLLRYKVMLYEGSNKIEFAYGFLYGGLPLVATIGIAASSTDFMSVTPGTPPSISSTRADNNVNIQTTGISSGVVYEFTPNKLVYTGRTGAGNEGVVNPVSGSTLLGDVETFYGTTNGYTPLSLSKGCAAPPIPLQMTISGPAASDYRFAATGTQNYNTTLSGAPVIPQINFTPSLGTLRPATLEIRNVASGEVRTFTLGASGLPRITWVGNVDQGGTADLADGDTLMQNVRIDFGETQTRTPITINNIIPFGVTTPAPITYTLIDPTGSYEIDRTSDAIDGGESSTPVITFHATQGVGTQEAQLIVNADGETRTFILRAFSSAPGGVLLVEGEQIDSTTPLMTNTYACVGEGIVSVEVTAVNTGTGDFIVRGMDAFATESVIQQGRPGYPLLRDEWGELIPMPGYFLSLAPGIPRTGATPPLDSLVVPEGGTRTFWLNMIPTQPNRQYARLFIRTNAFNLNDFNTDDVLIRGLVKVNAFVRGQGSVLAGGPEVARPTTTIFPTTEVRKSSRRTVHLFNDGECDLRINRDALRFVSGDVAAFTVISMLPNTGVDGEDYLIRPQTGDSIVVEFTPPSYGSHTATMRLMTNDSTLGIPGVVERGVMHLEFSGAGNIGLEIRDLTLSPAVIGGESSSGFVLIENTSLVPVEIEGFAITGGNGEFVEDPSNPWPARPLTLQPGESAKIWILFTPDPSSTEGTRTAGLTVQMTGGETGTGKITAYAGQRSLAVAPGALFGTAKAQIGGIMRGYVAVTNTGTLPVRLGTPTITGTNAANYSVSALVRRNIEPGMTEFFEVTFSPLAAGASQAVLTFPSNSIGAAPTVQLGGEGTSGTMLEGGGSNGANNARSIEGGSARLRSDNGDGLDLRLQALYPNPTGASTTLSYRLSTTQVVTIGLYDARGELVREIVAGERGAGEQSETLDLATLSSGRYMIRLEAGGAIVETPLILMR